MTSHPFNRLVTPWIPLGTPLFLSLIVVFCKVLLLFTVVGYILYVVCEMERKKESLLSSLLNKQLLSLALNVARKLWIADSSNMNGIRTTSLVSVK